MADKKIYTVHQDKPVVEEQPVLATLSLNAEQQELVKKITGKDVTQLQLSAIELAQVVDAVAFEHGNTVGASY